MATLSLSDLSVNSCLQVGQTLEHGTTRLCRYGFGLELVDAANAGKRGKVCTFIDFSMRTLEANPVCNAACDQLVTMIRDGAPFASMVSFLERNAGACEFVRHELKGVHVKPNGLAKLMVSGTGVYAEVTHESFLIRDLTDPNETTAIPRKAQDRNVRAFRAWLSSHVDMVRTSRFWDVIHAMRDAGIDCHTFCALD